MYGPDSVIQHVIMLEGDLRSDEDPRAVCTCGWESEPTSNLVSIGNEAKKHAVDTGHNLRQHPSDAANGI